jgi:hypothetical protein
MLERFCPLDFSTCEKLCRRTVRQLHPLQYMARTDRFRDVEKTLEIYGIRHGQ